MADRYWIGLANGPAGPAYTNLSSNWSATSGGAGGVSLPTNADNVFVDANSNPIPMQFSGNFAARNFNTIGFGSTLDFTGAGNVSLTGNTTINVPVTNPTLVKTITIVTGSDTPATLNLTDMGSNALIFNINAANGVLNLASNVNIGTFSVISNTGSINTNGYNITCSSTFGLASGATLNPSTSTIKASIINIVGLLGTNTGSTFIAEASFSGGGRSFTGTVRFEVPDGQTLLIAGNNTFNNLIFDAGLGSRLNFTAATTGVGQTITNFTINGKSEYCIVGSTAANGGRCTVNSVTMSNVIFDRFTPFAGGATWSGTNVGVIANAPAITPTPPTTVIASISGPKDWFDSSIWDLDRAPLPDDTAILNFVNASGDSIEHVGARVFYAGSLHLTSSEAVVVDNNIGAQRLTLLNGGYSVGPNITFVSAAQSPNLIFAAKNAGTYVISSGINPNIGHGCSSSALTIAANTHASATYIVDSDFRISAGIQLLGGTLSLAAGITLYTASFGSTGSSSRSLNMGAGTLHVKGSGTLLNFTGSMFNVNAGISTLVVEAVSTTGTSITTGGATFYNLVIAGNYNSLFSISGASTWNKISSIRTGTVWSLNLPSTQTVNEFEVSGTPGMLVNISGSGMVKTGGGIVSINYVELNGSSATPATNTWYAGGNSTARNSPGWILTFPPGTATPFSSLFFGGCI